MTSSILTSPDTESIKQFTKIFKLGLLLINRSGFKILSNLTILVNPRLSPVELISIMEKNTITKSS